MAIKISNSTIIDDSRNILDVNDATVTDLYVTGIASIAGSVGFTTDISIPDDAKINFGDGDDLQIYHDGSNSYIDESGTGQLVIRSNKTNIQKYTGETCGTFSADGSVELYYDNSKKFETTGIGISVSNGAASTATISGPSNIVIDPAIVGDTTGSVTIEGELDVNNDVNLNGLEISNTGQNITRANGNILLKAGGSQVTRNSIELRNGSGIVIDGGSGETYGVEIKGGGGPVQFTQGNVGIGTTNPTHKLEIVDSANQLQVTGNTARIRVNRSNGSGTNAFDFATEGLYDWAFGSVSVGSSDLIYRTRNDGGSTVDSLTMKWIGGNVGVKESNPTSDFQVNGESRADTFKTGVIGSQTSGILTTTATTANQVLDTLATGTFQTARYQVSIACTGQLITAGMTTAFTSVGSITAGSAYTGTTYTNVALTGGSGNDARANIGIGLSFNQVGFTSANNLIVTTTGHGLGIGVGTIAVSFASSIPNSGFTGFAVTAGNIYYAVGVGTTTLNLYQNANGTAQVTGIGTTTFAGVGNTMTKSGGVASVTIVSPGSGYETGDTLSATLGTVGSGFQFTVSTVVKNYQSSDVMILQSVGSAATTCDFIEYSSLANHEILGSFNADISGTDARLLFTPTYRNNTIKVVRTGITV